jgi:hypothetical protein
MTRPRVSIAGLMAVVLFCGIGIAAIRSASPLWAGVVMLATLGVMASAILGAIFRRGERRASWVGFALFGWGYLTLAFAPWFSTEVKPMLATSTGIDALHARLHPMSSWTSDLVISGVGGMPSNVWSTPIQVQGNVQVNTPATMTVTGSNVSWTQANGLYPLIVTGTPPVGPNQEEFRRIGHCLFSLLAAVIGGLIARRFASGTGRAVLPVEGLV